MEWVLAALGFALAGYLGWRLTRLHGVITHLEQRLRPERDEGGAEIPLDGELSRAPASLRRLARTSLKRVDLAEEQIRTERHHRRLLEALLDQIDHVVIIVDTALVVRFSNETTEALFETRKGSVNRSLMEVCRNHQVTRVAETVAANGGEKEEIIELDGQPHFVHASQLEYDIGIGNGVVLTLRDLTVQLETEQVRRDFVANASHELRTPLSILQGYLEMLEDDAEVIADPAKRDAVLKMGRHTGRLTRLVDDMLAISRLEGGFGSLAKTPFDLAECVSEVVDRLAPLIKESRVRVSIDFAEAREDRELVGDPFYWEQVFTNLIENAIKQNRSQNGLQIEIRGALIGGEFEMEVSDNGIGIPSADVPHVFARFYRVEKHHSDERTKGTGLGLSIVKRAVEAHGGGISLKSTPGVRTTFRIEVPQSLVE